MCVIGESSTEERGVADKSIKKNNEEIFTDSMISGLVMPFGTAANMGW